MAPAAAQTAPAATAQEAYELLREVVQGWRLSREQASTVLAVLGTGKLSEVETATLLATLHARGEESQKIAGTASASRQVARHFPSVSFSLVDIVDTGGNDVDTISISTGTGLVAVSMGAAVTKHGNRAVPSRTGATDVIAELELSLNVEPTTAVKLLACDHFTFLLTQTYHLAMRHVALVRKALATPMISNAPGSLMSPAHLTFQLMGIWDPGMLGMIAEAMVQLGHERTLVIHGSGLDEIAIHGPTFVCEATPGGVRTYEVTPADLGVPIYELADLLGGEPTDNARLLHEAASGEGRPVHRDAIAVSAGVLLYLTSRADSLTDGAATALKQILSDDAARRLESMTKASGLATETA